MSTGTNKERLTQNNGIINENNSDLTALKTRINNLPTSGDTTATAGDILLGKTAVSKGVKITGTYTPPTVSLQSKDVTINQNGTTTITADTGYDGLSDVDVTVSGILDTSDANATASDMASGKTAYVNGQKVTGNVFVVSSTGTTQLSASPYNYGSGFLQLLSRFYDSTLIRANGSAIVSIRDTDVAPVIGATASKIKKDEVICGVTGTYEGGESSTIKLVDGMKLGGSSYIPDNLDTSLVTNMSLVFSNTYITTIPMIDTSNVISMRYMFNGSQLTTLPLINTINVTDMYCIFYNCNNLTTIPQLDTTKVTDMRSMFTNNRNLSNESLNNILAMCVGATSYTGTKTLVWIGLSQTQATTCQTLSNWDAFVAAGWSSGY